MDSQVSVRARASGFKNAKKIAGGALLVPSDRMPERVHPHKPARYSPRRDAPARERDAGRSPSAPPHASAATARAQEDDSEPVSPASATAESRADAAPRAPIDRSSWARPWAQLKYFTFQPAIFPRLLGQVSPDARPGSDAAINARIGDLRSQVEAARLDLTQKRSQEASLESQLSGESEVNAVQTTDGVYRTQLADLQAQLDKLLLNYTEEYPDVVRVRHQIDDLKRQIQANDAKQQAARAAGTCADRPGDPGPLGCGAAGTPGGDGPPHPRAD